jgi:hypothetical protein
MQLGFGLTVLLSPAAINSVWPWPLSPLSARLLGASALVSVPLSIVTALLNRRSAAVIPLVMLLAYRVMQVLSVSSTSTGSTSRARSPGITLAAARCWGWCWPWRWPAARWASPSANGRPCCAAMPPSAWDRWRGR